MYVDVFGYLIGCKVGCCEGLCVDFSKVFCVVVDNGMVVEINVNWN